MGQSPDIMRAWECDSTTKCDGCGCGVDADAPMMFIQCGYGTAICLNCIRWALPQMEALEAQP